MTTADLVCALCARHRAKALGETFVRADLANCTARMSKAGQERALLEQGREMCLRGTGNVSRDRKCVL